jgi:hypothetical protein
MKSAIEIDSSIWREEIATMGTTVLQVQSSSRFKYNQTNTR